METCRFRLLFRKLFIAAYLSGDKQLLFAIEQDLHSYSSFLIFGQKWLDAGGSAEPVGNHLLKTADLRKSLKPFVLSTLRYRSSFF
jgi:hypothetical protein